MSNSHEQASPISESPKKINSFASLISTLAANFGKIAQRIRENQQKTAREMFEKMSINQQIKVFLTIEPIGDFIDINQNYLEKYGQSDQDYQNIQIEIIGKIRKLSFDLFIVNSFDLNIQDTDYKTIRSLDLGKFENVIMAAITRKS